MALYTTELAAEAMREKARVEIENAKRAAALEEARRRESFRAESAPTAAGHPIDRGVLEALTRAELYERAKQAGVSGRSKMKKSELIEAVRRVW